MTGVSPSRDGTWFGLVWFGLVRFGSDWFGSVRFALAWVVSAVLIRFRLNWVGLTSVGLFLLFFICADLVWLFCLVWLRFVFSRFVSCVHVLPSPSRWGGHRVIDGNMEFARMLKSLTAVMMAAQVRQQIRELSDVS